ncbi:hypothetical protein [Candidatus Electronema sp. JM]
MKKILAALLLSLAFAACAPHNSPPLEEDCGCSAQISPELPHNHTV